MQERSEKTRENEKKGEIGEWGIAYRVQGWEKLAR